jgi:hypothetical protein
MSATHETNQPCSTSQPRRWGWDRFDDRRRTLPCQPPGCQPAAKRVSPTLRFNSLTSLTPMCTPGPADTQVAIGRIEQRRLCRLHGWSGPGALCERRSSTTCEPSRGLTEPSAGGGATLQTPWASGVAGATHVRPSPQRAPAMPPQVSPSSPRHCTPQRFCHLPFLVFTFQWLCVSKAAAAHCRMHDSMTRGPIALPGLCVRRGCACSWPAARLQSGDR